MHAHDASVGEVVTIVVKVEVNEKIERAATDLMAQLPKLESRI